MYPLVPPPVSDTGAWTWPRTLQRWLDVNPVTKLTRFSTYITLPAFNTGNVWNGYSDIVASFNCESPNNFSLTGTATDVPLSVDYVLCISYQVQGKVTRYMLWSAQGAVMSQNIPLYVGQPILKNFRLEIWNTSQGATSQATSINFYTSVLGKQDYRYSGDVSLAGVDGENTNFQTSLENNTPTQTMLVAGAGLVTYNTNLNGKYLQVGTFNSAPWYTLNGALVVNPLTDGISIITNPYNNSKWLIIFASPTSPAVGFTQVGITQYATPDLVPEWTFYGFAQSQFPTVTNITAASAGTLPLTFPTTSVSKTN